ncbi:hypothetical protein HK100_008304 [Physocladia obscura]|uniref:Nuclear condensin complex subunit 3 C-terminal domain-containing protein n=1 Tax=Physocladia obscura TaxID=109957 RepID=A0AAD5SN14_9FUNG|nr:hypothetical protein HK100_008304 [Physocladia obscura]
MSKESDVLLTVADAVCDIDDSLQDENSTRFDAKMDPELQKLLVAMQCLEIIRALFEHIQMPPRSDPSFHCLLQRFIAPCVQNKNALLRQTGVHCLGLACYVDKNLSIENLNIFLHTFQSEESDGKKLVLQIVFDFVMVHGIDIIDSNTLIYIIKHALEFEDPEILTLAAEGASKLLIMKFITDEEILEALLVLYFHPQTATQHRLRQCLSCFLPMYALSSVENQAHLANIVVSAFSTLTISYEEENQGLPPADIAAQIIEWTDYRRIVRLENNKGDESHSIASNHGRVAVLLLECMIQEPDVQKEGIKMLNMLFVDDKILADERKRILKLVGDIEPMIIIDPTSLKGLKRFRDKVQDSKEKIKAEDSEDSE